MSIAPCTGCEKRTVGCHQSCVEYKDWKKSEAEAKKKRNAVRKGEDIICSFKVDAALKSTKKKKRAR